MTSELGFGGTECEIRNSEGHYRLSRVRNMWNIWIKSSRQVFFSNVKSDNTYLT